MRRLFAACMAGLCISMTGHTLTVETNLVELIIIEPYLVAEDPKTIGLRVIPGSVAVVAAEDCSAEVARVTTLARADEMDKFLALAVDQPYNPGSGAHCITAQKQFIIIPSIIVAAPRVCPVPIVDGIPDWNAALNGC